MVDRIPSPEQMRAMAIEYRTQASNATNIMNSVDDLMSLLNDRFSGDREILDRYCELRPVFIAMSDLLDEIAASYDAVAAEIELQNTNSEKFNDTQIY